MAAVKILFIKSIVFTNKNVPILPFLHTIKEHPALENYYLYLFNSSRAEFADLNNLLTTMSGSTKSHHTGC